MGITLGGGAGKAPKGENPKVTITPKVTVKVESETPKVSITPESEAPKLTVTKPTISIGEVKPVEMKTDTPTPKTTIGTKASTTKKTLIDDDPINSMISKHFGQSEWDNKIIMSLTGFDLIDAVLSSGSDVPEGLVCRTLNGLIGASGVGKTTLATQMAGKIVREGGKDSKLFFFDAEKASVIDRILALGVPKDKLVPPIKRGTTVEAFYGLIKVLRDARAKKREEMGEDYIMANPYVILVDSIASMPSEREIAADDDINKAMGTVARLHSALMKLYLDAMFEFNITVIFINQLRDKLTISGAPSPKDLMYGKPTETYPGGKALPYYSFTLMRLGRVCDLEEEKYGAQAIKVQVNFLKTKNSETNKPINMVFFPSYGYDNFWSNYVFLADNKVIVNGAFCKFAGDAQSMYGKTWRLKDSKTLYETNESFKQVFDMVLKEELRKLISHLKTLEPESMEINFDGGDGDGF